MVLTVWQCINNAFSRLAIIDSATSVIWTKRFQAAGEFEVYIRATSELLKLFTLPELFLTQDNDNGAMCVEKIQLTTNATDGNYLTITGRSAESLIARRIVSKQTNLDSKTETAIRKLMNENVVNPSVARRKITVISLESSHGWNETIRQQITGKNLLEAITDICVSYHYGFKLDFTGSGFVFKLYKGTDRSYDQSVNTFVVFSPEFENIGNTNYSRDKSTYYNSVYVAGQGEGSDRIVENVTATGKSDLDLREMWIDARNESTTTDDGEIPEAEYRQMLAQEASKEIALARETTEFSGELLDNNLYTYGTDYNLGDKVSVKNEFGITGSAIVSEIIEVDDEQGHRIYPTLSEWSV